VPAYSVPLNRFRTVISILKQKGKTDWRVPLLDEPAVAPKQRPAGYRMKKD
jgi:hypothetical protein